MFTKDSNIQQCKVVALHLATCPNTSKIITVRASDKDNYIQTLASIFDALSIDWSCKDIYDIELSNAIKKYNTTISDEYDANDIIDFFEYSVKADAILKKLTSKRTDTTHVLLEYPINDIFLPQNTPQYTHTKKRNYLLRDIDIVDIDLLHSDTDTNPNETIETLPAFNSFDNDSVVDYNKLVSTSFELPSKCKYQLLFHNSSNVTIIIKESNILDEVIVDLSEELTSLGVINNSHFEVVSKLFEGHGWESIEVAKTKLKTTLNFCKEFQDQNLQVDQVKNGILNFMNYNYVVTSNKKDGVKASVLIKELSESCKDISAPKLQNILPGILTTIGVNKRRAADGIYYYGLVNKAVLKSEAVVESSFQNLLKERNLENSQ